MMTKTKQQLRAEAVERLKQLKSKSYPIFNSDIGAAVADGSIDDAIDLLTNDCGPCYECSKLAELVTENSQLRVKVDEPANGNDGETNGIADGSPLVDELRHYADDVRYDYNPLDDVFEPDERLSELCGRVADMVERDYVSKNTMDGWLKAFQLEHGDGEMSLLDPVTLNDLWTAIANDIPLGYEASKRLADWLRIAEIILERDYVSREAYDDLRDEFVWETTFLHRMAKKCGTKDVPSLVAYVEQLEAKADELKAMNERLQVALDAVEGCDERCKKLESERDELKRKLEVADRHEFESDQMCDECKWRTDEQLAELIAERDEWKAKAEGSSKVRVGSSSAKRAAAVERLKDARYHTLADYVRAMLGWGHEPHFEDSRDALIDLLTDDDDCGHSADMSAKSADCVRNDGFMSEVGVRADDVDANDENATQDSRAKLEADLQTYLYEFGGYCSSSREGHTDNVDTFFDDFISLLDRQAAITEREQRNLALAFQTHSDETITELQAKNNKLREKVKHQAEQLAEVQDALHKRNEEIKPKWEKRLKKAQKENAELQAKLEAYERDFVNPLREIGITEHAFGIAQVLANEAEIQGGLQARVDELTAERSEIAKLVGWHGEVDGNGGEPLLVPMVAAMCEGSEVAADLQSDYDAIVAKCAELCALCGFSMVDVNGEVVG